MLTIRIGLGRSSTGAILDRETTWFRFEEKDHAIEQAIKTKKPIFISSKFGYRQITLEQLHNL